MNKVTEVQVHNIWNNSEITIDEKYDKLTIVTAKLPNGFTITESAGCVDPANYSLGIGLEICKKKIIDKIWYLEGYYLQQKLYEQNKGL
ncbi:hypothetical protein EYB35_07325 [Bacillus paranthracis]|nr:hypothetical protein EYB35_07325 [Bacillus paranthracis]